MAAAELGNDIIHRNFDEDAYTGLLMVRSIDVLTGLMLVQSPLTP
jgi:hypothetical protein